jgi:hypothetical protein
VIMLCYACEFLNGLNGSWKAGRKWKMMNVQDALQHQKPNIMLRKSVKLLT